jgi:phenylacetyl-CoA:acceptor oxidoreductase subunit 2
VLAALNALLWRTYVRAARAQGVPPLARRVLDRFTPSLHLLGHLVPFALAVAAWLAPVAATPLLAVGAVAAIAGGASWKFTLIVRAGYTQGFDLPRMPQRGSGRRAAPPRLDAAAAPPPARN